MSDVLLSMTLLLLLLGAGALALWLRLRAPRRRRIVEETSTALASMRQPNADSAARLIYPPPINLSESIGPAPRQRWIATTSLTSCGPIFSPTRATSRLRSRGISRQRPRTRITTQPTRPCGGSIWARAARRTLIRAPTSGLNSSCSEWGSCQRSSAQYTSVASGARPGFPDSLGPTPVSRLLKRGNPWRPSS